MTFGSSTMICPENACVFRSCFPKLGRFDQTIYMHCDYLISHWDRGVLHGIMTLFSAMNWVRMWKHDLD